MKKLISLLVLFLLCGCFPQSYQSIENKFKQDQCFKYHYQLLNKKQKQLYQIIYNIAYTRKQNIYIKEKEIDKVSQIVNAVLKDHPELFYIKEWSLNTKGLFNFEYSMKEKEILKRSKKDKENCQTTKRGYTRFKILSKINNIIDDVVLLIVSIMNKQNITKK